MEGRIILIDDDTEIRHVYSYYLRDLYPKKEILEFSSGNEAIDYLDNSISPTDLIICDYNMPSGSGDDVYNYVESKKISSPFILFTSENLEDLIHLRSFPNLRDNNFYLNKMDGIETFQKTVVNALNFQSKNVISA